MVTVGVFVGLALGFVLLWGKASSASLRRLFGFDGKATRAEFAARSVLFALCAALVVFAAGTLAQATGYTLLGSAIASFGIGVLWVEQLTVTIRRIRDIGWHVGKTLILGGLLWPLLLLALMLLPPDAGLRRGVVIVPRELRHIRRVRPERRLPSGAGHRHA